MVPYILLTAAGLGLCFGMAYVTDRIAEDLFRVRDANGALLAEGTTAK